MPIKRAHSLVLVGEPGTLPQMYEGATPVTGKQVEPMKKGEKRSDTQEMEAARAEADVGGSGRAPVHK